MKFTQELKNSKGFTLVELMVVVAIIGILSAVAIPNFKKYQAKTKTSEAKLQLAAIYSALTSLQTDYDAFAECLDYAGYVPPTQGNYYAVGFDSADDDRGGRAIVDANSGTGDCTADPISGVAQRKSVAGNSATQANLSEVIAVVSADGSTFVAGAIGYISADSAANISEADSWTINENKSLIHTNTGY